MSTLLPTSNGSADSGGDRDTQDARDVLLTNVGVEDSVDDDDGSAHSDMEDIETTFDQSTNLAADLPGVAVNGAVDDGYINDMKISISLAKAEIRQLSLYVSSAPESDSSLRNKRIRLNRRTEDLAMMNKAYLCGEEANETTIKHAQVSKVVPRNLPLFRWEGLAAAGPEGHVFVDVKTCLMNFVDVMNSHGLDLNDNYLRLLPPLLFGTTRIWHEDYINKFKSAYQRVPNWQEFSVAIQERYGLNAQEERNNCARELNIITMLPTENMEAFIDRFNSLRRRAVDQVLPDSLLVERFLSAIPITLSNQVTVASATLATYKQNDVDIIAALARSFFNRLARQERAAAAARANIHPGEAPRAPKRTAAAINNNEHLHQDSLLSRHAPGNSSINNSTIMAPAPSRAFSTPRPRTRTEKYCSFHRANTHNTADCRAANAQSNEQAPSGIEDRKCYTCGVSGWTRAHVCNTARREEITPGQEYNFGAMSFGSERIVGNNYAADAVATAEHAATIGASNAWANVNNTAGTILQHASSSAGDRAHITADARELALWAQQCKFHSVFSLPPDNKSNMIIIPVIIQNIRTYAIIDTGATFSMISPSFASFLGDSIVITPSSGTVQLGHVNNFCDRKGNVSINIFYNNKAFIHKFEIFDFFKTHNNRHIPALIGMDLFHQLRIGITGLAISHFDLQNNNPFPPSPVDPISKPNNSPFGTQVERDIMLSVLNPLLQNNAKIDMKNTFCNLPGAVIHLNTKPGCIAFKKQYPLPFAYEDAVRKQITTWLNEGVIEVATSHTGFNAPLLVVGRKNADGIFTFDKIRLVTDVRNLNSILTVTDTQSYPLINEIMSRIGGAKIHTIIDIKSCFNSFLVAG
ncbi:uncharacterized protein EV154DRAFT_584816 [Mucor mucedo]|uniref:uncharacterized protein n=1 Tax=Mucor mucedo TaxID=29922 RepID=UPI00221F53B2|nr:uncharacterized protein EV154DRAFT_584816 [Mucor mucedo]KAI7864874.1 hypothetical protein EV154DRAFT_584816 [Mucor mucedo]